MLINCWLDVQVPQSATCARLGHIGLDQVRVSTDKKEAGIMLASGDDGYRSLG